MKKLGIILGASILVLLTSFGVVRAATKDNFELKADATHQGLFVQAGDKVTIAGTVEGDVWVAGSEVEITGRVEGNVYAAGERVKVTGPVSGSVHAVGSSVSLEGIVYGTVYAAGSKVETTEGFRSVHAAVLVGSNVIIKGDIADQLYAAGSEVTLDGAVGQFARIDATEITVTASASVAGDLRYGSETQPTIANDKAIQGQIVQEDSIRKEADKNQTQSYVVGIILGLIWNVTLAAVLLAVAPRLFQTTNKAFTKAPFHNSFKALGFIVFVPVGIVLGLVTIIGIPVAVLALMAYISVILIAPVAVSYYIGQQIMQRTKTPVGRSDSYSQTFLATVVGLIAFTVATIIPVFGGLIGALLYLGGVGMLISRGFTALQSQTKNSSSDKPKPPKPAKTQIA